MLIALLIPLGLAALVYAVMLLRAAVAARLLPKAEGMVVGAITNFFDTLGIGSFAPTMAWFKLRKLVPDRLIPCTMLVGHTLPTLTELAERIDITLANLSILKTGKARAIRFSTLNAICDALGCQPGDILRFAADEGGDARD